MTDEEERLAIFYSATMEELKARVTTMSEIAYALRLPTSEIENRHSHFMFEGLYLQLRKVCELLSRAVLAVQSTKEGFTTADLNGAYRADKILKAVQAANPLCFPRPVAPGNWKAGEVEEVSEHEPVFTAEELCKAYVRCDELLHAWTMKDAQRERVKRLDQDFLKSWIVRLLDGLNHHVVSLPDEHRHMFVAMHDSESANVSCILACKLS